MNVGGHKLSGINEYHHNNDRARNKEEIEGYG